MTKVEKELREAVFALNRALGALVDDVEVPTPEAAQEYHNLECARNLAWHVGVRMFGWTD